jgi:hypothetical protein
MLDSQTLHTPFSAMKIIAAGPKGSVVVDDASFLVHWLGFSLRKFGRAAAGSVPLGIRTVVEERLGMIKDYLWPLYEPKAALVPLTDPVGGLSRRKICYFRCPLTSYLHPQSRPMRYRGWKIKPL